MAGSTYYNPLRLAIVLMASEIVIVLIASEIAIVFMAFEIAIVLMAFEIAMAPSSPMELLVRL